MKSHHIYNKENSSQPLFHSQSSLYSLRKRKLKGIYTVQRHPLNGTAEAHTSLNFLLSSLECSNQLLKKYSFGEHYCSLPYGGVAGNHSANALERHTSCFGWYSSFYMDSLFMVGPVFHMCR